MKKLVSFVCIAAILLSFAACSNDKNTSTDGESVTVSWHIPLSAQNDMAAVMEAAAKITEPLAGAKLDIQTIDTSAFKERMNMLMASGSKFDLAFTGYVNPYLNAVSRGGLMELTALIDEHAPTLKEAIPDYAWEAASINGKVYAVPNVQGFAPPSSLLIREDMLEKYNFDINTVKAMEDIEPFLAAVKAGEPNLYPFRPYYTTDMWTGGIYEEINSGVAIRADGSSPEVFFLNETPEYQKALDTMHDWYKKGYIRTDLLSAGSDTQDVKVGKYVVNQSGWLPGAEQSAKLNNGGYDMVIYPMMQPYLSKTKALATMVGIGIGSQNAEKAIKLVELMNTNCELYNLISFGIEGKHYTKDEEGKVIINSDAGYVTNSAWLFGNQFNAMLLSGQDDDLWEQTKKMNDESVTSPLLGFALDTESIKNEISQISAVSSEFPPTTFIVNGKADWDAYIAKLNDAGREKVLEEIQRQVNEYWENR